MGIYGFGYMREKFSKISRDLNERIGTFDVTKKSPAVIRHMLTNWRNGGEDEGDNSNDLPRRMAVCIDITPFVIQTLKLVRTFAEFETCLGRMLNASNELEFLRRNRPHRLVYTIDNRAPRAKRHTQIQRNVESTSTVSRMYRCAATAVDTTAVAKHLDTKRLRLHQIFHNIQNVLGQSTFQLGIEDTVIDCTVGEGEMKAVLWLYRNGGDYQSIVMARDNDVYIYVLSILLRKYWYDQPIVSPCDIKPIFIFHEHTRTTLICWSELFLRLRGKCWVFILWMSICFGNDYAHGILERSLCSYVTHFDFLQKYIMDRNISSKLSEHPYVKNTATATTMYRQMRVPTQTAHNIVIAVTELQWALSKYDEELMMCGDMTPYKSSDVTTAVKGPSGLMLRQWLKRQLWSLCYVLDMPCDFCDSSRFDTIPSMAVNIDMAMPAMDKKQFKNIDEQELKDAINSLVNPYPEYL